VGREKDDSAEKMLLKRSVKRISREKSYLGEGKGYITERRWLASCDQEGERLVRKGKRG